MFNKKFIRIIGFFTINLYNFISVSQRVLLTEYIRQHLTVDATATDKFTDGYL